MIAGRNEQIARTKTQSMRTVYVVTSAVGQGVETMYESTTVFLSVPRVSVIIARSYRCVLPAYCSNIWSCRTCLIMSSRFDRKESFDGEKTSARVMRACDGNPSQSALAGYTIFEIIRHDETGPFFGECVYIVNIAFSA